MIINFRSINDEKIWETWDLKNYVNNFIFPPNSSYFLRIQQNWDMKILRKSKKLKKSFEIFRKNLKNKSFAGEILDILIFCFTICQGFIKKSEKIWKVMRKTLRIKKKNWVEIPKNCRKWVLQKNLPLSHQCPKTYRKSEKIFEFREILKKFLRKSEKISKKIWEKFLLCSIPIKFQPVINQLTMILIFFRLIEKISPRVERVLRLNPRISVISRAESYRVVINLGRQYCGRNSGGWPREFSDS